MESLPVQPSWFVRAVRATPILRALIPVEGPESFKAGSDYASGLPAAPAFDVRRSMSAYGAFPWVVACCGAVSSDLSGVPLQVTIGGEVVDDHPVLELHSIHEINLILLYYYLRCCFLQPYLITFKFIFKPF